MFNIFFGTVWSLICLPSLYISIINGETSIVGILILIVFNVFGLIIFSIGVREILINNATEKNGERCFGKISKIDITGERVNNRDLYKASVLVYIESESKMELVEEKIGFDKFKYEIGSYVYVKYYCGDINFEYSVHEKNVPEYIKEKLDKEYNLIPKEDQIEEDDIVEIEKTQNDEETVTNAAITIHMIQGVYLIIFGIVWTISLFQFFGALFFVEEDIVMKMFMGISLIAGIICIIVGIFRILKYSILSKNKNFLNKEFFEKKENFNKYNASSELEGHDDPIKKF